MWTKFALQIALIVIVFFYMFRAHQSGNLKKRNELFYISVYFLLVFLLSYPVRLSFHLGLFLFALFAMGAMLYQIWSKKLDRSFVFFAFAFAALGTAFLLQDMSERTWGFFSAFRLPEGKEILRRDDKRPSTREYLYHAQVSPQNEKWRLSKTISDFGIQNIEQEE